MGTTSNDVQVLVKGKPVEHSFRVLKNGGAVIGLKQDVLDAKASKTTKKPAKKQTKAPKSEATIDGVRFDGDQAIIRIGGKDVETIAAPGGSKPRKAWKKAINSNLWNVQGGNKDQAIWNHKVGYGDMPSE